MTQFFHYLMEKVQHNMETSPQTVIGKTLLKGKRCRVDSGHSGPGPGGSEYGEVTQGPLPQALLTDP